MAVLRPENKADRQVTAVFRRPEEKRRDWQAMAVLRPENKADRQVTAVSKTRREEKRLAGNGCP